MTPVWVSSPKGERSQGHVIAPANTPRSYVVETPTGEVKRNSSHLVPRIPVPNNESGIKESKNAVNEAGSTSKEIDQTDHSKEQIPRMHSPIATRLRTGTKIHPPERYRESSQKGEL